MLLNVSSCAQYTMRPSKWSCQSLEQGEVYCRAKQKEWVTRAQNFELLDGFQGEVFNGQNLRWRLQSVWLYSERLVWGNRVVFQESCSHPQDTSLYLGGSLRSCRRTQRFIMSIPSGGTRTLPHCSGAGFPVRVRVYKVWEKKKSTMLGLRIGTVSYKFALTKSIANSLSSVTKGRRQRVFYTQEPHSVLKVKSES